jgi:hypothetical protein
VSRSEVGDPITVAGSTVLKTISVPGKLVSVVVI